MINLSQYVDLKWTSDGDYSLSNGDLADTKKVKDLGFIQEVTTRIKSSVNDWKLSQSKGAGVADFKGEANNQSTWTRMEAAISLSLTYDGFLSVSDFEIAVAPVDKESIMVYLDLKQALTTVV